MDDDVEDFIEAHLLENVNDTTGLASDVTTKEKVYLQA